MIKIFACLLLTLMAAGCGTFYSAVDRGGDNTFTNTYISITKELEPLQVTIEITNVSTSDMEILWDKCRYTDLAGKSYTIIHTHVTFDEKGNGINPPTILKPGETVNDFITPIDALKHRETLHDRKVMMWATHRETVEQIFIVGEEIDYRNKKELLPLVGKSYALLIVVQVDGEEKEYSLAGKITGVIDLLK
jgi:hypothetical protein